MRREVVFTALLVSGVAAGPVWVLWIEWRKRRRRERALDAHLVLMEAARAPAGQWEKLLASVCATCEQVRREDPEDKLAQEIWARALWLGATRGPASERDGLLAKAEEKFSPELPGYTKRQQALIRVLLERAACNPGEVGRGFLERACRLAAALASGEPDPTGDTIDLWRHALYVQALRTSDADARRLSALAEQKATLALSMTPDDPDRLHALGEILLLRCTLHPVEDGAAFIERAMEQFDAVLRKHPGHSRALAFRSYALCDRAARTPDEATARLVEEFNRRLEEAAAQQDCDRDVIFGGWGMALLAQAMCATEEEATRLRLEAKKKLLEAETPAAYNVACACALLGETEECRHWLEVSREPGLLVSSDSMRRQQEFESVRGERWFIERLGQGETGP